MRIGSGWDIHRLEEGATLVLGGVIIPSAKGLVAHSDGDVLIHAIIDAILGALAEGDIGTHFPDTDPRFEGASSVDLLDHVITKLLPPYSIGNIDTTIILKEPKLRPHIDSIRYSLADILEVPIDHVSVKAKTAEGLLGELGTGDAIEAHATVLLTIKG
ncbi:MAG TPA: 2-C-methyl-D-erythritol 2,4-cyclodiphosphate synthase [Sphaerochaeta sp.]|jgi:2-C-methyl-D-erythritol 2,4-cyclodiphosphate synthase|nr:2-C-methyl-D-erythritol 2,4-cyclodiphosphate synthase [Sphaerochaeta sp.]HOR79614.1 2-C-methyl-D-erythritol 2,4-cyclodiphosphate synthase [Sphaerochaeta sp.]HPK63372.1 2-C-methyl-D-erythritol 2,4-cyclodiphosphate synthase [Sphaerochaeta sp.]HRV24887.1 2-C-methyl-D-erythritol 2,4-cyclodiphosphate synthase [Sphaerochaeta sp.]